MEITKEQQIINQLNNEIDIELPEKERKQLEEWTSLKCSEIVFNSDVDNWSINTSIFNERIIGKKQLVFLIEDENNEKFGYYLNTDVVEEYGKTIETDNNSFSFNLKSNGRLKKPMKYEITNCKRGGYWLYQKEQSSLLFIGDISIEKSNLKTESWCWQNKSYFNYHNIEHALCKNTTGKSKTYFIPKKILVIQMK